MVKRTLLATLAVILFPLLLWAWEEPDNFQGLRFDVDVTQAIPECLHDTPSAQQRQMGSCRWRHHRQGVVMPPVEPPMSKA